MLKQPLKSAYVVATGKEPDFTNWAKNRVRRPEPKGGGTQFSSQRSQILGGHDFGPHKIPSALHAEKRNKNLVLFHVVGNNLKSS